MLKAYKCHNSEGLGIIVFADTPGKARAVAFHSEFGDNEYNFIDIEVRREKEADKYWKLAIGNILDFSSHAKIYRSLGWYCEGNSTACCDKCGLYEYGTLPESIVDKSTGLCKGCTS